MEMTGLFFYLVSVLIAGGIYAVLCLALNVQWGMGGLFNAGIAGFFAVGAYASAIITTAASTKHLGGFGLPIPLGLVAAMIVAGATGWIRRPKSLRGGLKEAIYRGVWPRFPQSPKSLRLVDRQ